MQHTVATYDDELNELRSTVAEMGGLAEQQLSAAVDALQSRDPDQARAIIADDRRIDGYEVKVDELVVQLIARRGPVADDLREIIAGLKIAAMLERIGDVAKNIAKRVSVIVREDPIKPAGSIPQMADEARKMVNTVLDAYVERDSEKAMAVWLADQRVDALYNSIFREMLTYMMESPKTITAATHLLFIAKNIERVGDQATNIAEVIFFAIEGEVLEDKRPKADTTAFTAV